MTAATHASAADGFPDSLVDEVLGAALALPGVTPIFAIAGLQGSGKSTLAAQVAALARTRGCRVAVLSIDDFYLRKAERQRLARRMHPLLSLRGPPGTHDPALAMQILDNLQSGKPTRLPRFDKLADDRLPETQWAEMREGCDLVVLEGWFLKTPAQDPAELIEPANALERDEDAEARWRSWCNAALANDYAALWQRIDALWFLQGPDFDVVPQWRWQQEQTLQAAQPRRVAMNREQVERFVQLFERVSRQALRTLPAIAERTIRLDAQRTPEI